MKNNIYNKVTIAGASLLVVLLTAFSGCSVDEIETFDEHDYLSFQKSTMAYTFAFSSEDVKSVEFEIPVAYAGRYSDTDRAFVFSAVPDKSTAQEGVDYQMVDAAQQIIKAGTNSGMGKIRLLRTAALKEEPKKLVLAIAANDNFLPGVADTLTVNISDQIVKPTWWDWNMDRWLGQYTKTKLLLLLEFMGVEDGSNPFDTEEYCHYVLYTGYTEPSIIYHEWTVMPKFREFHQWLINTKNNPMDPDLGMPVSETLGTF